MLENHRALLVGLSCWAVGMGCAGGGQRQTAAHPKKEAVRPAEQVFPPDKLLAVQETLRRKATQVQSCYLEAREQQADRPVAGDLVLEMTLLPTGRAVDIQVVKTDLHARPVEACVEERLRSWEFGELPSAGRLRWTFHFEPVL